MIEARGLTKRYGEKLALDELDLAIGAGEWFLYLGLNGAGKSTTMQLLMGLTGRTAGAARVAGFDPWREGSALRRAVGYLPQDFTPYDYLTGRENLRFVGDMHGLARVDRDRRADRLLELLDLDVDAERLTRDYSHGMRKKLGLAAALIHEPRVLILDEPTAELDPRTSDLVRRVLRGLADQGVTVMMSTHILGTTEKHCDRVGILHAGRLLRVERPADLAAEFPGRSLEDVFLELTGGAEGDPVRTWLEERGA